MNWKTLFFISISSLLCVNGGVIQDVLSSLDTNIAEWLKNEPKINAVCAACSYGMNRVLNATNATEVLNNTIEFCINLELGNELFCEDFVYLNKDEIMYIHEHASENMTGEDICGLMFGSWFGCETDNPAFVWVVTLPDVPKPPVDEPPLAEPGMPTLKVLHLADTHFDPLYFPGADTTNCPELYLCCRESNGIPLDPKDGAGYWGDYRVCDSPKWTLEALYDHIITTHPDIDFIIWTGDIVPHDVWETSRDSNLAIIRTMADLVSEHFPGIPVFPAVGNHEGNPMNLFSQPYVTDPEFSMTWLYDELTSIWQRWLPSEAATSVAYGAYYSVEIRPGLRVLSLNTNFCYGLNFWLVLDSNDVAQELSKIAQELQKAEDNGENVYIIGHHPSGNKDCILTWSHEFNKIVSRYENTVTGIFYGHTHNDHYQLFFDPSDPSRVYEVAYVAPSQTTYTKLNPGYKIYTIEGDFQNSKYRVLDHENWIMDLDTSNLMNQTTFSLLYSAKEDYGLSDLSPQSWLDFTYQMNEPNSTIFVDFYRNFVKAGTPSVENGCDEDCKSEILCRILISDTSDRSHCEALLKGNYH